MRYTVVLVGLIGFALLACAGGLSEEARSRVTVLEPFDQLQRDPEKFRGQTALLGGKVVDVRVESGMTELVVLQLELDGRQRPKDNDRSQGRFLLRSDQFLDPAIYPKGTLVSAVGQIMGAQTYAIGNMPYRYPVVRIIEIKKWAPGSGGSPRFHFGFGVGTRI